jgi:phenylacetate-coenzyme A ligase PaaK-like adenylate-forming protein
MMIQRAIYKTPLDFWVNNKIGSPNELLTRPIIAEYQLRKLQEIVDWAYQRSPFYHNHLQVFAKQKISCLEDLTCLPFTTSAHIQESALQMLCVAQGEINRVVTLDTTGTTGKPKRLYFTRDDQELTIDFFQQAMSTFTEPGDRVFILLPGDRPDSVGDLLAKALERLGATPIKHGTIRSLTETLQRLSDTQANILVGIPIQALALAKFYETSHSVAPLALQRMLLSTDYVSQAIIKEIGRILKCEVFDHYGMTEMGLGVGIECCAHHGYHLREADLYIEVIDPQTGGLLPEGQYGELVFTTLTRRGMPLIRYRSGDLSRLLSGKCLCGTALKNLDYIRARKDKGILLDDNCYLIIADLDEALLMLPGVVDFIANVSPGQEFTSLTIKIMILEDGIIKESDVRDSLNRIASIHMAGDNERLRISLEFIKCNDDFITQVCKRKINVGFVNN